MDLIPPPPRRPTVLLMPGDRRVLHGAALRHAGAQPDAGLAAGDRRGRARRLARRFGVPPRMVPRLGDTDMARLTAAFRRHGSVRQVRQEAEAILGRLAWAHRNHERE